MPALGTSFYRTGIVIGMFKNVFESFEFEAHATVQEVAFLKMGSKYCWSCVIS
jgi:hypothetical protein